MKTVEGKNVGGAGISFNAPNSKQQMMIFPRNGIIIVVNFVETCLLHLKKTNSATNNGHKSKL
jgi:hypothetical protein